MTVDFPQQGKVTSTHAAWYVCATVAGIVLIGAVPIYYSHVAHPVLSDPYKWGQFSIPFQVLIGLSDLINGFISFVLAILLFWRKPNDRMALFASFFFLITTVTGTYVLDNFLTAYVGTPSTRDHYTALTLPLWILLFCIFPDGRFVPRWTLWLFLVSILISFSFFFANTEWRSILEFTVGPQFILVMYAQLYRYRRVSSDTERQQTKWVIFGLLVTIVLSWIASLIYKKPSGPLLNLIPLMLAIAILRSRLWDIDLIINRTLVYGALTTSVVGLYVFIVGGLGAFLQTQNNLPGIVIAILLIAFLFQPLRLGIQRLVNRVTFGGRDVPSPNPEIEESPSESQISLRGRWLAWLLFTFICILSALSFIFLALSWSTRVPDTWGFRGDAVILALAFGSIGLLLARHHPQNPIGWLLLAAGLVNAILELCIEYATYAMLTKPGGLPYGTLAAWTASWIWVVAIGMLIYSFLLFPTGQLPSARWRPVAWFFVGAFGLMTSVFMIRPGPLYFAPYLDNPFAVQVTYRVLSPIPIATAGAVLLVGISVVLRLRRAEGVERQQLKWFAYAVTLRVIMGVAEAVGLRGLGPKFYQYLSVAIWIAIAVAIAFAIMRYRLWDIDIFINRSLVYGTLILSVIALYVVVVGVAGAVLQFVGNTFLAILATGLIAVLFHPLRLRLQRSINQLMYGERDDPYAALSRLGRRLEASLAPEAVLPTVVTTVRDVLKLPYVAIYLQQDSHGYKIVAESASPSLRMEGGRVRVPGMNREGLCIPLIHQGETLGYIVLGPRAPNEAFGSTDLRLLDDLAPQVGVAVHAVRLTADLQRSREQLVLAREEERRRLRRDLHDDLAPTLAALGLTASTVADLISTNPTTATALAKELQTEIRATVGNIRRLVYDLRPPTLDELGLLAAIRERAAQYSSAPDGFHVTVDSPAELPALPAAVEVAAYRIVQEALENVSKHSQARQCTIRFTNHHELEIEITDDGIGLPSNFIPGVGLRSMRERAEELGGSCVIEGGVNSGTRVLACLPIGDFHGRVTRIDRG